DLPGGADVPTSSGADVQESALEKFAVGTERLRGGEAARRCAHYAGTLDTKHSIVVGEGRAQTGTVSPGGGGERCGGHAHQREHLHIRGSPVRTARAAA